MTNPAYWIERSRAGEPMWYEAPHPPGTAPRPYQHAAVEYALGRGNTLIGDAPGVGKTPEGVLLSNALGARRTLVVCPAALRLNWQREVWRWSTTPNVRVHVMRRAADGVDPDADYVVTSYELASQAATLRALKAQRWDHLLMDEAHYLKDPKGNKRTRAICDEDGLRSACGQLTMLTGTPMPNQPIEVYQAIRLLNWDAINRDSVEGFRRFYYDEGSGFVTRRVFDPGAGRYVAKTEWSTRVRNVPRRLDDLQARLRAYLMVRRLKADVLPQLPERQWHLFPVESPAVREAMRHPGWSRVEHLHDLDPGAFDGEAPIDGEVSTARRLLGEAVAPLMAGYVAELLREGVQKVLVGCWHRSVLAYLREELDPWGVAYVDGSDAARQAAVDAFQEDPGVRVALGQERVLGLGWTLTAAQDAVLVEPPWAPGDLDQVLDRLHRFGQEGERVLGHVPIVPGTIYERVVARAVEKARVTHAALDA